MTVEYRSWSCQNSQNLQIHASSFTQPLSLHYVLISCNMKPQSSEFMCLERENLYTRQVRRGCKI